MTGTYKLVVGDRIEFDVKFSLNDGGVDKPFGMRLTARRQPLQDQERELHEQVKVQEFLDGRGVTLTQWIGKAPMEDDQGQPAPASKDALDALYTQVGGMVHLVLAAYMQANGARGKSGN
ncbi:hypothetical protein LNV47_22725 [Paucibacter sp. DJ4R-1]|nr:hypothetical protein [Paucibacter sp. DJ4R-1]